VHFGDSNGEKSVDATPNCRGPKANGRAACQSPFEVQRVMRAFRSLTSWSGSKAHVANRKKNGDEVAQE